MSNNEYSRTFTKKISTHVEGDELLIEGTTHMEGEELIFDDINFLPETIDYNDSDSIEMMATSAIHTADGFYDLVKANCNITNPDISSSAHLEIYLALSGLACEIYMKAIIYFENLHNGKQVRGHKLDELFNKLPQAVQSGIIGKVNNIKGILPNISDIFTRLRYDFEQNRISGDYLLVFELMEELKTVAYTYPQKACGVMKYAKGCLLLE